MSTDMTAKIYTNDSGLKEEFGDYVTLFTDETMDDGLFPDTIIPLHAMVWFDNEDASKYVMDCLIDAGVPDDEIYYKNPDTSYAEICVTAERFINKFKRPDFVKTLSEIEDVDTKKIPHYRTGIKLLDDEIGGLYVGQVSVLFSYAGEGKSTLASAIMCNIATNTSAKCLAYSGELEDYVFKDWTFHQLASKTWIDELEWWKPYMGEALGSSIMLVKNGGQFLPDMNKQQAEDLGSKVMLQLQECVEYDSRIKFILVDNLMTAMDELPSGADVLVAQSNFMQNLVSFAIDYGVHVMLVCHCKKENFKQEMNMYDISGTANIPNKASTIMSIRRDDKAGCSYLSLYKDRYSGARLLNEGEQDNRIKLKYIVETRNYKQPRCKDPSSDSDFKYMPLKQFRDKVMEVVNSNGVKFPESYKISE